MRKFVLITIAVMAVIGIMVAGFRFSAGGQSGAKEAAVSVSEVVIGSVESVVTAQGTLEPKDYVDVGAQVSGLIVKMHAEVGDAVRQGDIIAEIDPDVYAAQVRGGEARLKTLQAQKAEQEALIRQSRQKYQRNVNLMKSKAVSEEVLEDSKTSLDIAEARLLSLEAQIEEAQSTLEGAKTNLGYTKIYAPMGGVVVSQPVKEGQTINANQTAPVIARIANLDIMTVKAQVAEADIMKLDTGMSMYFTTLGSSERRWQGTVRQILPSPETINDVVLYNVLVDVDNTGNQLMTGMTAQMFFLLGREENIPVVPVAALLKRVPESDAAKGKAYQVRVMNGRIAEDRTVIVGLNDRARAAVVEGLEAGDRVLVNTPPASQSSAERRPRMPRL